jgi:hypothetical protein
MVGELTTPWKNGLGGESDRGGESFVSTVMTLSFNREKWTFFFVRERERKKNE